MNVLYHASRVPNLTKLEPRISNHGTPLVYLADKRASVLVYLSNPVERHCKRIGFAHKGSFYKFASYGFSPDGKPVQVMEAEFVPDAYEAILQAEREGTILIRRYQEHSPEKIGWIAKMAKAEYQKSEKYPEYRVFLRAKFSEYLD